MPKWNTADPGAREYLLSVARFWVEKYDIDGWRIDVSNEVSHDFWREMCKQVRAIKPDIYILGENWDDSYPWLNGGQFDGTMNYSLLRSVGNYINGRLDAAGFISSLSREVLAAYPKPVQRVLYNLLDSHDTDRLMTSCCGNAKVVMLGYVILMTMAGCPSVFYGGEIGLDGTLDDGYTRRCMPWDVPVPPERDFRPFLKKMIALRKKHPSFRSTEITFRKPDDGLLVYTKEAKEEELVVIINNGSEEYESMLPRGQFLDLLNDEYVTDKVIIPPYGFLILLKIDRE